MEIQNLYDLKETLSQQQILICFSGPFSHSVIEELGNAVKRYLEAEQLTKASMMDVFSIFIEQTQNVRNYARRKLASGNHDHDFSSGIVVIGRSDDRHVVCSGNLVERKDIAGAIERLDRLKGLDKQALKAVYKEQLRQERREDEGGGLGLIDMSRRTTQPLEYSLTPVDEHYCFFSLKATV